jgi:hypothetical protein
MAPLAAVDWATAGAARRIDIKAERMTRSISAVDSLNELSTEYTGKNSAAR